MPSGIQARKLLLSLISISLAAESMRSMGALITASTNPRQPCPIPPHRGVSPREATYIILRRNQGSQITAITNPCDHVHLSHDMSPVATGSGGPSGLEDSPHSLARENGKRARSPQIKSVLCCTQAGEPTGNDSHYPKRDSGHGNYYYHESQLALLLNR